MQTRKMSVAGTAWLHDRDMRNKSSCHAQEEELLHDGGDEGELSMAGKSSVLDCFGKTTDLIPEGCRPAISGNYPRKVTSKERYTGVPVKKTEELLLRIRNERHTIFARQVRLFLLAIALCHTCLPDRGANGVTKFQAASPDEVALVHAAQDLGYEVVDRQSDSITIRFCPDGPDSSPVQEIYEVLNVLEFSSDRRRMSIVIRMPDQRVCVFCKGADMVIVHRLRQSGLVNERSGESPARSERGSASQYEQIDSLVEEYLTADDTAVLVSCLQHVNDFASEGLPTLLYACRYVAEAEHAIWRRSYQEATTSLVSRQSLIEQAGDQLE